jgi:hypothetical protein
MERKLLYNVPKTPVCLETTGININKSDDEKRHEIDHQVKVAAIIRTFRWYKFILIMDLNLYQQLRQS